MVDARVREGVAAQPFDAATDHDEDSLDREMLKKRRKVRKGTRSCWECKRRKTRCIFESSEDITCLACHRRRATCISQDLPEDLAPAKHGNRHLSERISRVEDLMTDLLAGKHVERGRHFGDDPRQSKSSTTIIATPNDLTRSSFKASAILSEVSNTAAH